jgi:hypothetical protein
MIPPVAKMQKKCRPAAQGPGFEKNRGLVISLPASHGRASRKAGGHQPIIF